MSDDKTTNTFTVIDGGKNGAKPQSTLSTSYPKASKAPAEDEDLWDTIGRSDKPNTQRRPSAPASKPTEIDSPHDLFDNVPV